MASRVAVAVLAAFVFLDLAKFFISERFGTGAAWLLQQDVRALRRSVAQATTPRSLAHRVARERLLRDKERTLLRMQTATLRRALFCSHYISVLKGVLGAAVAINMVFLYPYTLLARMRSLPATLAAPVSDDAPSADDLQLELAEAFENTIENTMALSLFEANTSARLEAVRDNLLMPPPSAAEESTLRALPAPDKAAAETAAAAAAAAPLALSPAPPPDDDPDDFDDF